MKEQLDMAKLAKALGAERLVKCVGRVATSERWRCLQTSTRGSELWNVAIEHRSGLDGTNAGRFSSGRLSKARRSRRERTETRRRAGRTDATRRAIAGEDDETAQRKRCRAGP